VLASEVDESTHLGYFLERPSCEAFNQRYTKCPPVVLTEVEHSISEGRGFRDVKVCLWGSAITFKQHRLMDCIPSVGMKQRNRSTKI
jgi:hypothetical protein